MAKRRDSMPLTISRADTSLAVVRLTPLRSQVSQTNGHDTPCAVEDHGVVDHVQALIRNNRLDEANRVVLNLLQQRIDTDDKQLSAASMLLQHYEIVLSRQPPLSHIGARPLRPNDSLYACFDQFIELIRRQQSQISELQAIIAELI